MPLRSSPPPDRYICIHGHFYQPPRENPWLETVETQDSAAPYHDWNERITAECYAPNGASRIVNGENQIIRILNNYARISFNFGPTLLSWLEENAPRAYRIILEADRRSQQRFGGHGSAMAQVYNHIIMPLANTRDKRDPDPLGHRRFRTPLRPQAGRHVAGGDRGRHRDAGTARRSMASSSRCWRPHQCARVRPLPEQPKRKRNADQAKPKPAKASPGQETPNASVDPTRPYLVRLKRAAASPSFSTTGRAPAPSPSKAC